MKNKTVRIDVDELKLLPPEKLEIIQGDLKDLPVASYNHLRDEIDDLGFSFAIHAWLNPKTKRLEVLDGTQRLRTILKMREEGFECPKVPVAIVRAKSRKEAARKLLGGAGAYGKPSSQGLYEFMHAFGIEPIELERIELMNIDVPKFRAEYFDEPSASGKTDDDAVPEPPRVARTKRGELWTLGDHRLLCGDCTSHEDLDRLMAGEKADMVFTDPPYNVDYDYKFYCHKKSASEYLTWTDVWVRSAATALKDEAWFFTKNAPRNLIDFLPLVRGAGFEFRNLIVWVHPSHLFPSNRFYDNWEAIAAFARGKPTFETKAETRTVERPLSEGGGTHDGGRIGDVWDGIKYISAGAMKSKEAVIRDGTNEKAHPAQMPLKLPRRAIEFCAPKHGVVLETFCGSGTTLIACEQTGRRCRALEIAPEYCDVIIERWATLTGKDPVRADGKRWSKLKAA